MRFASLGSGSKGNALIVSSGDTHVLLDCGLPLKQLEPALVRLGLSVESLAAVFITHEHGDHIRGLRGLIRRQKMPIYMTRGTALGADCMHLPDLHFIQDQQQVAINALRIHVVSVPHDAREPCQYVVSMAADEVALSSLDGAKNSKRLGLLTDLGCQSQHVIDAYADCDGLVLECNHDVAMLQEGPYPASVKRRVLGDWGHLSNVQARDLLVQLRPEKLQWLVLAHISQKNNSVPLAVQEIQSVFPDHGRLIVADQDNGFDWLELV